MEAAYGSAQLQPKTVPGRWRINRVAMLEAVLVPWAIFLCVSWLLTFSVHYKHTVPMWVLVVACLIVPVGMWYRVWHQRQDSKDISHREPNWFFFLAVVCTLAWLAGVVLGLYTWSSYMQPYFEAESLAMITNVDTRKASGGQFLDMGALEFAPNTDVDESLTMGYKDGNLYCVAPIATSGGVNSTPPAFYEFWAVGVNCCNPFEPKLFACGEPNDDQVRGGFRLTDTSLVPQYRKAIQMAQEEYHIRSGQSPIFLHWTGDPVEKTEGQYRKGESTFWRFCWVYLGVSAVLALIEVATRKYS
ncbi:unnamed protein product [Symbiodinium natans]|uniref:Uncharacterized protein n=1 Tax=Symbiodinium natans TaxID=878477 RepID=A0A812RYQ0_9DINO|nr:unnamed protein product [Symbiodinium natans]